MSGLYKNRKKIERDWIGVWKQILELDKDSKE